MLTKVETRKSIRRPTKHTTNFTVGKLELSLIPIKLDFFSLEISTMQKETSKMIS